MVAYILVVIDFAYNSSNGDNTMSAVLTSAWQVKVKFLYFGNMSLKAESIIKRCGVRVAYKYVHM